MNANLLPEYESCSGETLHCRCTVCGGWWAMDSALNRTPLAVPYWCPHCGQRLTPAQYPDDPKPTPEPTVRQELEL